MRATGLAPCLAVAAILQISFGAHAWAQAPSPPPAANPAPAAPPAEPGAPPPYTPPPGSPPPPGYAPPPGYPPPPGYAPPPGYPSAGAPQAYPPALRPPFSGPVVMLRASAPRARLQMQTQLKWVDVCVAPCGVPVDPRGTYRVGGGSYRGSDAFRMPRSDGQVLIDARVGSQPKHIVGMVLMIVGIADVAGGILIYSLASHVNNDTSTTGVDTQGLYRFEGIVGIVAGAILLAVGIPMMATSGTSVDVH